MTIGEKVKAETAVLHKQAERHHFLHSMMDGQLPIEAYGAYLSQMLHLHRSLEAAIRSYQDAEPLRGVLKKEQFREELILADLQAIGQPVGEPSEATNALVASIEAFLPVSDASTVLGMHYVQEGSISGGRYIARAIAHVYGLKSGPGLNYLNPYGAGQPARMQEFRDAMNSAVQDEAVSDSLIRGAIFMFLGVIGVLERLGATWAAEAATPRLASTHEASDNGAQAAA